MIHIRYTNKLTEEQIVKDPMPWWNLDKCIEHLATFPHFREWDIELVRNGIILYRGHPEDKTVINLQGCNYISITVNI